MPKLEAIVPGMPLVGIEPTGVVTVVAVMPIADGAVQLVYKTSDGTLKEILLNRGDEDLRSPPSRTLRLSSKMISEPGRASTWRTL